MLSWVVYEKSFMPLWGGGGGPVYVHIVLQNQYDHDVNTASLLFWNFYSELDSAMTELQVLNV